MVISDVSLAIPDCQQNHQQSADRLASRLNCRLAGELDLQIAVNDHGECHRSPSKRDNQGHCFPGDHCHCLIVVTITKSSSDSLPNRKLSSRNDQTMATRCHRTGFSASAI